MCYTYATMPACIEFGTAAYESRIHTAEETAAARYIDLPYHNFDHALHTRRVAIDLGMLCIDNGIEVDLLALDIASLFHDADFHRPLPPSIRSRELRSSRIAGQEMRRLQIPHTTILTAQRAIRSTELGRPSSGVEEIIECRADLDNVMSNYPSFLLNTYRLYRERAFFNDGKLPPLAQFITGSVAVLRKYLEVDLTLGEFDQQSFMSRAIMNINRLERETPNTFLKRLENWAIDQAVSL